MQRQALDLQGQSGMRHGGQQFAVDLVLYLEHVKRTTEDLTEALLGFRKDVWPRFRIARGQRGSVRSVLQSGTQFCEPPSPVHGYQSVAVV